MEAADAARPRPGQEFLQPDPFRPAAGDEFIRAHAPIMTEHGAAGLSRAVASLRRRSENPSLDCGGMQPPDASEDLVVSTPERVAFQYETAVIGSRFLAQVLDVVAIGLIQLVITILAASLAGLFNAGELAVLVELILTFVLLAGYFMVSEAAMNGQTVGKRAVRLRVVGDQGEPLTIGQAVTRNLVRVVDFLPALYAVGIVVMFANR